MKKAIAITFILILGLALRAGALEVEAYSVTGDVQMAKSGSAKWLPVTKGVLIESNYTVRTGADGAAILRWMSGNAIKLSPMTSLNIEKLDQAAGAETTLLNLSSGRVYARAKKLAGDKSSFKIKTPTALAAVRGTEFMAEVTADGKTLLAVMEGQILVEAQGITVILDTNYQITVEPNQPPGEIFNISNELKAQLTQESKAVTQASAAPASSIEVPVPDPGTETTVTPDAPPADTTAKPADTTEKPTDTTDKPADTNAEKPADTTEKPADTTAEKPADTTAKPADTTAEKPADTTEKPADTTAEKPADTTAKPADTTVDKKPDTTTTDKTVEKPADKTVEKPVDKKPEPVTTPKKEPVPTDIIEDSVSLIVDEIIHRELIDLVVDEIIMHGSCSGY